MPSSQDLQEAAECLRDELGDQPYMTTTRAALSDLVREVSGEGGTRLKKKMSRELQERLSRLGIRMFPPLDDTENRTIRLFPSTGPVAQLVDAIVDPGGSDPVLSRWLRSSRP